MKKSLLLSLGLMLFGLQSYAQDVIHVFDQRPIEAKVLEITDDYVRYKTFDNLEGPDYRMSVARIVRIVFENGTEKVFSQASPFASRYYGPVRYRRGHFYDGYGRIGRERLDDMGIALYGSEYRKARNQTYWGFSLTTLGSALIVTSLIGSSMIRDYNRTCSGLDSSWSISNDTDVLFGVIGAGCLAAGIPLWIGGNRKFNKIADDYNRMNGGRQDTGYAPSVELRSGGNGIGLALRF